MAEAFNPYLKWLGIRQPGNPPHHYTLLGLELFESDPEAISNAADQRMAHVRTFATGPHTALSQRVLNELAAARIDLLDPSKKQPYDAALRRQLSPPAPIVAKPRQVSVAAQPAPAPQRVPQPIGAASPAEIVRKSSAPVGRKANNHALVLGLGVAVAVAVLAVGALILNSQSGTPNHVAEVPAGDQPPAPASTPQPTAVEELSEENNETSARDTSEGPAAESTSRSVDDHAGDAVPPSSSDEPPDADANETPVASPVPAATEERSDTERPDEKPVAEPAPPVTPADATPPPEEPPPAADSAERIGPAPQRAPAPEAAVLKEESRVVRQLFTAEIASAKTSPDKSSLAHEMVRRANEEPATSASRYALLELAREVALEANNLTLAFATIDETAADFEIDALLEKAAALDAAAKNGRGAEGAHKVVGYAFALFDKAIAAEDFSQAQALAALAVRVARRAKDAELTQASAAKTGEAKRLAEMAQLAAAARATLQDSPTDEAANQQLGSYLCLARGQWDEGLEFLAKGPAGPLRTLAELDATRPTEPETTANLAKKWADQGQDHPGVIRRHLFDRARHWYEKAAQSTDGLLAVQVRKEVESLPVNELAPEDSQATRKSAFDSRRAGRGNLVRAMIAGAGEDEVAFFVNGEEVLVCTLPAKKDIYLRPGDIITVKQVDTLPPGEMTCVIRGYDSPLLLISAPEVWKQYVPLDPARPCDPDGITQVRPCTQTAKANRKEVDEIAGVHVDSLWGDGKLCFLCLEVPSAR